MHQAFGIDTAFRDSTFLFYRLHYKESTIFRKYLARPVPKPDGLMDFEIRIISTFVFIPGSLATFLPGVSRKRIMLSKSFKSLHHAVRVLVFLTNAPDAQVYQHPYIATIFYTQVQREYRL